MFLANARLTRRENQLRNSAHDCSAALFVVRPNPPCKRYPSATYLLVLIFCLAPLPSLCCTPACVSVGEALESIPEGNQKRCIVSIGGGEYWEKFTIQKSKPFVTLCGDALNMPVIVFNGTAEDYGLWNCSTVAVEADNFVAANIVFKFRKLTVRNLNRDQQNSAPPPDGKRPGAQAVAMRISGDKAAFYGCKFLGYQDTLFDDQGRHYFQYCFIQGTVDFIFGDGKSIYKDTVIESVTKESGVITAQARNSMDDTGGYVFLECNITGTGRILLGRAYRPWSKVVFAHTFMDTLIDRAGWSDFGNLGNDKTVYYGEYENWGPGADTFGRVNYARKLTSEEASPFLNVNYIDGDSWLPCY